MYYAGIGSRETPSNILKIMTQVAMKLDNLGFILRSGGAKGADQAFEAGAVRKEIFTAKDSTKESIHLASKFHPNWNACSNYAKQLHGRNCLIVLGKNLNSPVDFVICWTPGARVSGGTGQALRLASAYYIPVFNLACKEHLERLTNFINENNT